METVWKHPKLCTARKFQPNQSQCLEPIGVSNVILDVKSSKESELPENVCWFRHLHHLSLSNETCWAEQCCIESSKKNVSEMLTIVLSSCQDVDDCFPAPGVARSSARAPERRCSPQPSQRSPIFAAPSQRQLPRHHRDRRYYTSYVKDSFVLA